MANLFRIFIFWSIGLLFAGTVAVAAVFLWLLITNQDSAVLSRIDQGGATLLGAFVAFTATAATAYGEYRRNIEQSSGAAALLLLNEIVRISQEACDRVRMISRVTGVDYESWSWINALVTPGAAAATRKAVKSIDIQATKRAVSSLKVNSNAKQLPKLLELLIQDNARSIFSEVDDLLESGVDDRLRFYMAFKPNPTALLLYSNRSAYERALPILRNLSSSTDWAEALFAVGQFYEACDYVSANGR